MICRRTKNTGTLAVQQVFTLVSLEKVADTSMRIDEFRTWFKSVKRFHCFLPPANEVCEGYVFTGVCHSVHRGGVRGCSGGVHGCSGGGMRGCSWGVVHGCSGGGMRGCSWGGSVWFLWGGMHGCSGGACMVAPRGACVVALGGAWLLRGGMHGFFDEIRSMSRRYASYWNAFLLCWRWCC